MLDNGYAEAGCVISHFKTERAFHTGNVHCIFTPELLAVFMTFSYLVDLPYTFLSILFCVDPKATLLALASALADNKFRPDIIFEIKYMIHCLLAKGTSVDLCWVPSTMDYLVTNGLTE